MKTQCWFLTLAGLMAILRPVQGNVIFSQDFSSDPNGPLSAFVSPTPDQGKWNSITSWGSGTSAGVVNGALSFTRGSSGAAMFTRSTDFSPAPSGMIFTFDLSVGSTTTKSSSPAAVWQIGSDFATGIGSQSAANVHSQFGLTIYDTHGGFKFRDLTTGTESSGYSGSFPITWVINNSTAPLQYSAPNGTTRAVAADHWDLWCGPYPVLSGSDATTSGRPLTDLHFGLTAASGTLTMDNFSIGTLPAVPEPAATGTVAGAFLVIAAAVVEFRRRISQRKVSS